jgi:hypothetical protein
MWRRALMIVVVAAAGLSCRGDEEDYDCDGQLQLSMTAGAAPEFRWSPSGCWMTFLEVRLLPDGPVADTTVVWRVTGRFQSAVDYGITPTPDGATSIGPVPLVTGEQYRARIANSGCDLQTGCWSYGDDLTFTQ